MGTLFFRIADHTSSDPFCPGSFYFFQKSPGSATLLCDRKISEITGKTIKNHIFLIGIGMGNAQTLAK